MFPDPRHRREMKTEATAKACGEVPLTSCDRELHHKDGTTVWTAWTETRGPTGGLIRVGRDITKRERMEEELRRHRDHLSELVNARTAELEQTNVKLQESESRYSALFTGITDAVFVHHITPDRRPGKLIEVNDVACRMLGYSREELLSMEIGDIDAPESDVDVRHIVRELQSGRDIVFPRQMWGGIWGRALLEKRTECVNESLPVPKGHVPIDRALVVPVIDQGEAIGHILVANKAMDYDEKDSNP